MSRSRLAIALLLVAGLSAGSAARLVAQPAAPAAEPAPADGLSDVDKLYGLATFWKEVSYNFAFFDQVPTLDWDAAYQAFIPKVLATTSDYAYYKVLQQFSALLGDGHTNVFLPEAMHGVYTDFPAVELQEVDRRALVVNVDSALADRVPLGAEVVAVDGVPVHTYLRERVFPYISTSTEAILWEMGIRGNLYFDVGLLAGPPGSDVAVRLALPDGAERTVTLVRDRAARDVHWTRPHAGGPGELLEIAWPEPGIAHVRLNSFAEERIVEAFEAHLPSLYEARGVVLDLRGNGGGNTDIGARIAGHLTADTLFGSVWRTREHKAAYKAWARFAPEDDPFRAWYRGDAWFEGDAYTHVPAAGRKLEMPVVVLAGRNTGSAAEDFLVLVDRVPHLTVVGEPTFGSTGQPLFLELPGGGAARICTKRDTYPDGRDFVGYGVQPDVLVRPTAADVRAERDVVLARGLDVLRDRLGD